MEMRKATTKRQNRSTQSQLRSLIEYMSLYPAFAKNDLHGPEGMRIAEAKWEEIRQMLKAQGQDKTIEQWKQSWRDLKRKAKATFAEAAAVSAATGNPNIVVPDSIELILRIIGHDGTTGSPNDDGLGRMVLMKASDTLPSTSSEQEFYNNGDSKSNGEDNDGSQDSDSNPPTKKYVMQKQIKSKRNSVNSNEYMKPKILKSSDNLEFRLFGELVATQLSQMPLQNAIQLQSKIQNIISEERLMLLNGHDPFHEVYTESHGQKWNDDSDG